MRTGNIIFLLTAWFALGACNLLDDGMNDTKKGSDNSGYISLMFDDSKLYVTESGTRLSLRDAKTINAVAQVGTHTATQAGAFKTAAQAGAQLDTNGFLLRITDQSGKSVYSGKYGDSPENILVGAGTYNIRAVSEEFSKPAFDAPQWGDEQYVKVESGGNTVVKLVCRQMNSGVRLNISSSFLTDYSDAALLLKNKDGSLMYSYRETRTAYFNPGPVELVMSRGGVDEVLLERTLAEREILQLSINTTSRQAGHNYVSIAVDTSRNYTSDVLTLGESGSQTQKGQDISNAFTITQAKAAIGEKDVWVGAYIVGGDLTSKGISFETPFSSSSNFAIGSRSNTTSRDKCIAVQLPSGTIRDNLNLVDHPGWLGHYIYLHGDIVESYFGLVGMKNIDDYSLK